MEAYLLGTTPTASSPTPPTTPTRPTPTGAPSEHRTTSCAQQPLSENPQKISYAQATSQPQAAKEPHQKPNNHTAKKPEKPDTRLFIRLPDNHPARNYDAYALLSKFQQLIEKGKEAICNVQVTKTGFAFCTPTTEALEYLEKYTEQITQSFGPGCRAERSTKWASYRIRNIPRQVCQINDDFTYSTKVVDESMIKEAILDRIGQSPVKANMTRSSAEDLSKGSLHWNVHFLEEGLPTMPSQISIFGFTTYLTKLTKKTIVVQCSKCFKWHNQRSCNEEQRCRLCGTTNHTEITHPQCGDSSPNHQCGIKCLHCHGPHPADSKDCPLVPNPKMGPLTKSQKVSIRNTGKADRLRQADASPCQKELELPDRPLTPNDTTILEGSPQTHLSAHATLSKAITARSSQNIFEDSPIHFALNAEQ